MPTVKRLAVLVITPPQASTSTATDMKTDSRSIINHQAGTTIAIAYARCDITTWMPVETVVAMM